MHPRGDSVGDVHATNPCRRKVPPGRPDNGLKRAQHARADDRGNRIGRVVEPIDEIEHERREKDQGNVRILEDVEQVGKKRGHSGLLVVAATQLILTMTPWSTLATSSSRSVIFSIVS